MNKLPRVLEQLAEAKDLPRALFLPELQAIGKILNSGLERPFPGVRISSHDLEVARSIFRTFWVVEIEGVKVTLTSKAWSASKRRPAPVPRNLEQSIADAEFRA